MSLLSGFRSALLAASTLVLPLAIAPAGVQAAPASEADMSLYTRIAALNVCIARAGGVDFDKAVVIAGETIAQVIQGQHGGYIQQVGPKALSIDELRKGAVNSAVLGSVEVCPKEVPADVTKKVQDLLKAKGAAGPSAPATPATQPAAPAGKSALPGAKP